MLDSNSSNSSRSVEDTDVDVLVLMPKMELNLRTTQCTADPEVDFEDSTMISPLDDSGVSINGIDENDTTPEAEQPAPTTSSPANGVIDVSLTTFELLEYTAQNQQSSCPASIMHVSMSEEVNETSLTAPDSSVMQAPPPPSVAETDVAVTPTVVRRFKRNKSESNVVIKKRVSFHEDILNSRRIDDVHIYRGFVTRRPPTTPSVGDRYSWAAEGEIAAHQSTSQWRRSDPTIRLLDNIKSLLTFSAPEPNELPIDRQCAIAAQNDEGEGDGAELTPVTPTTVTPTNNNSLNLAARQHLRLTRSEGFYPNYPDFNVEHVAPNVVICDSNVYEHHGVSATFDVSMTTPPVMRKSWWQDGFSWFRTGSGCTATTTTIIAADEDDNQNNDVAEMVVAEQSEKSQRHLDSSKCTSDTSGNIVVNATDDSSSLLKRFLRNTTLRKAVQKLSGRNRQPLNIQSYVPRVLTDRRRDYLDVELDEVLTLNACKMEEQCQFDRNLRLQLQKNNIILDDDILKVYRVRTVYDVHGNSTAYYLLLTPNVIGWILAKRFRLVRIVTYAAIKMILIGPNGHVFYIVAHEPNLTSGVMTGCRYQTDEIITWIAFLMRRKCSSSGKNSNNNCCWIQQLSAADMTQLKSAIYQQSSVVAGENLYFYSTICVEDVASMPASGRSPTIKTGYLMWSTDDQLKWSMGYCMLKFGVLYVFEAPSERIPLNAYHLECCLQSAGHLALEASRRPFTFYLCTKSGETVYFAAANQYQASDWLQCCLLHTTDCRHLHYRPNESDDYCNDDGISAEFSCKFCTLIVIGGYIVMVREVLPAPLPLLNTSINLPTQPVVLSCGAITNLVAFRVPSMQENWCILEFSCSEVHESSGDWMVYFTSNAHLVEFLEVVSDSWRRQNLLGQIFPFVAMDSNDLLVRLCEEHNRNVFSR